MDSISPLTTSSPSTFPSLSVVRDKEGRELYKINMGTKKKVFAMAKKALKRWMLTP